MEDMSPNSIPVSLLPSLHTLSPFLSPSLCVCVCCVNVWVSGSLGFALKVSVSHVF